MRRNTLKNTHIERPGLTYTARVHFGVEDKGKLRLKPGPEPVPVEAPVGRVPKLSRLRRWQSRSRGCWRRAR